MFESILYEGTMIVAQIHESLMHLNDNFELYFGDKDMHFIVMAVLGMILFFMVHFVFKRLAKWSITAISFIYVFTVMTVLGLAIEIGRRSRVRAIWIFGTWWRAYTACLRSSRSTRFTGSSCCWCGI